MRNRWQAAVALAAALWAGIGAAQAEPGERGAADTSEPELPRLELDRSASDPLVQTILVPAAGSPWLTSLNERRLGLDRVASTLLTVWSGLHVVAGLGGSFLTDDERRTAFLRMDGLVNLVVLGTAVVGLVAADATDPRGLSYAASLGKGLTLERLLFAGIALDVAAGVGGGLLWRLGNCESSDQITGWGQALALNGGLLLLFDVAVLVINAGFDQELLDVLGRSPGGSAAPGIGWRF
jgi:hypothetical protein